MTPTISGSRLTFMRGSQNLDDTVNFLSIPSTMRPGICPGRHMLQMLGKACMRAGHNVHGMSKISRRAACSLAFRACCGSVVCAGLCFFATTISHSTHLGRKHATSKTKRPRYAHHASQEPFGALPATVAYTFSRLPRRSNFMAKTLPTDGPDGWFGRVGNRCLAR